MLAVPPGTIVTVREDEGTVVYLADLEKAGEEVIVAKGGRGGWGNTHFTSPTNQAPHFYQRGEIGEERTVLLEMRLIADVGLVGYPNAGKSTLLAAASAAKPKIASYPFTTIEPVLGVVNVGLESFVIAEIPGLIEGAHLGKGLGHDFLRHALRTKIFIHIIGGDSESPSADMLQVNQELASFDASLALRPQIVVLNKIDLPEVEERLAGIKKELSEAGIKARYISAATGQGVTELMSETMKVLKEATVEESLPAASKKVFRPQPKEAGISVSREGDEFVIRVTELERIVPGAGTTPAELRWQLNSRLERMGVTKALEKAGARPGDKIRCGELIWEW